MNWKLKSALGLGALILGTQAMAGVTFYEGENFHGRVFSADRPVANFKRVGFNDRASSVIVENGRWEVCEDVSFHGHCMVLRPGSYESLTRMGMNDRISSVRQVAGHGRQLAEAPEPLPAPNYEYRRRPEESIFEVPVSSVRAVVGPPSQRCWVEREKVSEQRRPNTGGAIIGALIGGVIGHQVGGGSGRDVATAGGAVAGAVIGSHVGNDNDATSIRDVRHCENLPSGPPQYWDVTYFFQGDEHHVQMMAPPGPTILVNRKGEPRQ